ncbi:hypothetical protein GCM10022247_52620 [Allokutzneria multivorans]|uniref:Uncharacterized protein n=1 Tax=Allokutzneria multivorans TaxID=1142134 RepID=A0ABP7T8I0_9PSEU
MATRVRELLLVAASLVLLLPAAPAAHGSTQDRAAEVGLETEHGTQYSSFAFAGNVETIGGRPHLVGELTGGCVRQKVTATLHWKVLPEGKESTVALACSDTDHSARGVRALVSEPVAHEGKGGTLAVWLCRNSSTEGYSCGAVQAMGRQLAAFGEAKLITAGGGLSGFFRGSVLKDSGKLLLSGVMESSLGENNFCPKYVGMSLKVTYRPGGQTRGDISVCPPKDFSRNKLRAQTALLDELDATSVEARMCAVKANATEECSETTTIQL